MTINPYTKMIKKINHNKKTNNIYSMSELNYNDA